MNDRPNNCVEWFAGIGGFHCAWLDFFRAQSNQLDEDYRDWTAFDINDQAQSIYRKNFQGRYHCQTIESLSVKKATDLGVSPGGFWWMSPPCQPFTQRGLGQKETDPRSKAFSNLLILLEHFQPEALGLENVPEFWNSLPCKNLLELLQKLGYHLAARFLCPTHFGIPMKRKRFFLIASKKPLENNFDRLIFEKNQTQSDLIASQAPLSGYLLDKAEVDRVPSLFFNEDEIEKYSNGMNVLKESLLDQSNIKTNCFTKAYGKSYTKSGSFLETNDGRIRRFHPTELLKLFGFPENFRLTCQLPIPLRSQYSLLGNSLSIDCVRFCLKGIFGEVADK